MAAGMAIFGPDPIFIGLAVLLAAGVLVTRWKTRVGAVVIALPSLAIEAFAGSSAIFVVTHPIAFIDAFGGLFTVLAVLALVNIAVVGTLTERPVSAIRSPRASAVVAGLAVVLLAVVAVLGGAARLGFTNATAATGDTRIEMKDTKYSTGSLDSTQSVNIYITNSDPTLHTFTIDGAVNQAVPANSHGKVSINLKPGHYHYYCAVPGHAETMHGTLTVH